MSADSATLYEPLKGIREREEKERNKTDDVYAENGQREGTNIESGAKRRIFEAWLRSMGSARVD